MAKNKDLEEIASGAGIVFIGILITYFLGFLYQLFAARHLGPELFGYFSLGLVIIGFGSVIGQLGLSKGINRFVAYYLSQKDHAKVKGTIYSTLILSFVSSLSISLILFLSAEFIAVTFFKNAEATYIVKIFSFGIPFLVFTLIVQQIFLAFRKPLLKTTLEIFVDKALKLGLLFLVILASGSVIMVSYSYILGIVFLAISYSIALLFFLRKGTRPKYNYKELVVFSFPLLLTVTIGEMYRRFDKLIIGYFVDSIAVGFYTIAFQFAEILTLTMTALLALYFPIITGYLQKNKLKNISELYNSVSKLSFLTTLPLFIFYLLFSDNILHVIYGVEYLPASLSMKILSVGFMLSLFLGPSIITLSAFKKTKEIFYLSLIAFSVNIILNISLVPFFGIEGVALATLFSVMLQRTLGYLRVKKLILIKKKLMPYLKYMLSIFVSLIFLFIAREILVFNSFLSLFIVGTIFASIYFVFLIAFKAFDEEDKDLLVSLESKIGLKIFKGVFNR